MSTRITPQQLLERALAFRSNHSIDVVALANDLGITVYSVNDNRSAWIQHDQATGKYSIYINKSEPYTRQRFSIAHELSHFVLHPQQLQEQGRLDRVEQPDPSEAETEKQADRLAAELLMPEQIVNEYLLENNVDTAKFPVGAVTSLAEHFKVSNFVAVMRLRELKIYVPFLDFS